jgi:adenylate cyclase
MAEASPSAGIAAADPGTSRFGAFRAGLTQIGPWRLLAMAAVLIGAVFVARLAWQVPLLLIAERGLYDIRVDVTAPRVDQDQRVVLVTFVEETLRNTGKRSPLDRVLLGRALANLDRLGARGIGVDVLIDQPQPGDAGLEAAMAAMRTPTFFAFTTSADTGDYVFPWQEAYLRGLFARVGGGATRPASIRLDVDSDNAWRAWPRAVRQPPALLVDAITGPHGYAGFRDPAGYAGFRDPAGYAGGRKDFTGFSGAVVFRKPAFVDRPVFASYQVDLFGDAETAEAFRSAIAGKIVLIGADLPEADRFITPFTRLSGKTTAGVELHATLIAQALDGRRPVPIPSALLWAAALLTVAAAALTGGFDLSVRLVVPLALAQLAIIIGGPVVLQAAGFDTYGLPGFGLGAGWLIGITAASTTARLVGAEQRRFAQGALGKYLPRDVARQILRNPERLALSGERREIHALFSDIEGFTSMCQSLAPEIVAAMLNEYLDRMSDIVLAHGGTIDKFVGDAVVAFWGAPLARADDAQRALAAAIAMAAAGQQLMTQPAGRPPLGRTRIGLHRGVAVVGNFGGDGRIQYTALGDAMNVAARLEGANKTLKSSVLVSHEAAAPIGLDRFRPLGRVRVRGRDRPIEVYEPVGAGSAVADPALAAAYARFDAGDAAALAVLQAAAAAAPADRTLGLLVERLAHVGPGGVFDLD